MDSNQTVALPQFPQRIGRYEILGELGRGAMGIVYKGFDPNIGRTIAIKTVQLGGGTDAEDLLKRFKREAQAAGLLSHPHIVYGKLHQMRFAIADVIATAMNPFAPLVIIEFAVELHIRSTEPNFLSIYAWEVRLAADARAEANIESLIPHIQFPNVRRVAHGEKIDRGSQLSIRTRHLMRHINNIFVGTDAAERRDDVVRQLVRFHFESPTRMRGTTNRALLLGPPECVQAKLGPMLV